MSDADNDSSPPPGFWSQTWAKIVVPVLVAVIAALVIAIVTPLGDNVKEFLFPTKATVSGLVRLNGAPAPGARVAVGDHTANTDEGGTFALTGIGKGTHTLVADASAAKQTSVTFAVQKGDSTVPLDPIDLKPVVRLRYFRSLTQGAFHLNPPPAPPMVDINYEIVLWIEGGPAAIKGVESVAYRLPAPLSSAPIVIGAAGRRNHFCYGTSGVLSSAHSNLTGTPLAVAHAVVNLGGGHSLTTSARAGEERPTFACHRFGPGPTPPPPTTTTSAPTTTTVPTTTPKPTTTSTPTTTPTTTTTPTPLVAVPNVVGQSLASAISTLQGAGFQTSVVTVVSAEAAGVVASQSPTVGAKVARGTVVRLNVSDGSGHVPTVQTIPNVVGMSEAVAKATLESKGFVVSITRQSTTDPSLDGVVLSQSPAPGSKASEGDKVGVVVGRR
jgi:PASTA domain